MKNKNIVWHSWVLRAKALAEFVQAPQGLQRLSEGFRPQLNDHAIWRNKFIGFNDLHEPWLSSCQPRRGFNMLSEGFMKHEVVQSNPSRSVSIRPDPCPIVRYAFGQGP